MNIKEIVTWFSAIAMLFGGAVYVATTASNAESAAKQARSNAEQIQLLTDLHKQQATEEEAKLKYTLSLCFENKLTGSDCKNAEAEARRRGWIIGER